MITVNRNISGSFVVVMLSPNPWNGGDQAYIDARKDARYPDRSFIEYVRSGQVQHRVVAYNSVAPEIIMQMVRNILKGNPP